MEKKKGWSGERGCGRCGAEPTMAQTIVTRLSHVVTDPNMMIRVSTFTHKYALRREVALNLLNMTADYHAARCVLHV